MPTLEQRRLGGTGLMVSCVGLGTVKIGRNQGVRYPSSFELPDDLTVAGLLDTARGLGINLLDTAPAYGESESRLGRLLTDRQNWVVCTKVGEEFVNGRSRFDFSGKHVQASIERSLKRLNTDYLDIVLIHSDGNDLEILGNSACLESLQRLKQEGLIRCYGISTKTVAGGLLAAKVCDVIMLTYNPLETADGEVIDCASAQGCGVLIKKALASGHLNRLEGSGGEPVADSLRFVFAKPGVCSVIIGTLSSQHLSENVRAAMAAVRSAAQD